jgi:hypothetical protein
MPAGPRRGHTPPAAPRAALTHPAPAAAPLLPLAPHCTLRHAPDRMSTYIRSRSGPKGCHCAQGHEACAMVAPRAHLHAVVRHHGRALPTLLGLTLTPVWLSLCRADTHPRGAGQQVRLHVRLQHVAAVQAGACQVSHDAGMMARATASGCEKGIGTLGYRMWWQPRSCRGKGLLCGVDRARDASCTLAAHMVQVVSAVPPAIYRLEPAVSALLHKVILATRLRARLALVPSGCVFDLVRHADFTWPLGAARPPLFTRQASDLNSLAHEY